ncbi:zinc finger protein 510-like [Oppia nitens]|uniref:zinc finger protein 510-like n=1 Tax=Oppia nitens TaxID=1686743 RepID=UPI0023DAB5A7|nr:zinc finger protein 510-like [Oppia nitens]
MTAFDYHLTQETMDDNNDDKTIPIDNHVISDYVDDLDVMQVIDSKEIITELVNNDDPRLTFISPERAKSEAWSKYQRIYFKDIETNYVKCIVCNDIKKQTKYLGTATLLKHKCVKTYKPLFEDHSEVKEIYNDKQYLIELIKTSDERLSFEPKTGKSQVWTRFERIVFNQKATLYVKCMFCNDILKNTQNTGTASLLKHKCRSDDNTTGVRHRRSKKKTPKINFKDFLLSKKCKTIEDKIRIENQTLQLIIKKCLEVMDRCLCVDNSITIDKKRINVLLNAYNEWLSDNQDLDDLGDNINGNNFIDLFDNCLIDEPFRGINDIELSLDDPDYSPQLVSKSSTVFRTKQIKTKIQSSSVIASNLVKRKYQRNNTSVTIKCDWPECEQVFNNSYHLNLHRNKHLGIFKYKCCWPGCEESFPKKIKYEVHMSLHTNEKQYKCNFNGCQYETCRKALLQRHYFIHTGEKPFKCDWPGCEFRTSSKNGLRHHNYRHTGEKPWKCKWVNNDGTKCEWSFRQKTHLKAHMLKHTGDRPYQCEWPHGNCERRFASRQAMRFHSEKFHNYIIPMK